MSSFLYTSFATKLLNGGAIDLDTDTIKLALVKSAYVPDQDAHDFFNDITNETSGTGYTAGGMALASKTVTQDNTNNRATFDANDVSWPNSSVTARYGVLYKDTGNAATSPLIALIDFLEDKVTSLSTFTVPWNAEGILSLAVT